MTRGCSCAARGCTANKSALPRFFRGRARFFQGVQAPRRRRPAQDKSAVPGHGRPPPAPPVVSEIKRKLPFRPERELSPAANTETAPHNWPEGFRTARLYSTAALCEEAAGAVGRLLAISSSTSCGACTAGALAEEDEEAAGFLSLSVTAYR